MNRKIAMILVLVMLTSATVLSVTAFASADTMGNIEYYDRHGNKIVVEGMYYNNRGLPMFNAGCYYIDTDGDPVYVGGGRAYHYNSSNRLTALSYYYDADGNQAARPNSYPGGYGCGMWYYDADGNIVTGTFYYDANGNIVEMPSHGCCRGGGRR